MTKSVQHPCHGFPAWKCAKKNALRSMEAANIFNQISSTFHTVRWLRLFLKSCFTIQTQAVLNGALHPFNLLNSLNWLLRLIGWAKLGSPKTMGSLVMIRSSGMCFIYYVLYIKKHIFLASCKSVHAKKKWRKKNWSQKKNNANLPPRKTNSWPLKIDSWKMVQFLLKRSLFSLGTFVHFPGGGTINGVFWCHFLEESH